MATNPSSKQADEMNPPRRQSAGRLDNSVGDVASSGYGNDPPLVVRSTIRLLSGDAGRALAAAQGAALRRLLALLEATEVNEEP